MIARSLLRAVVTLSQCVVVNILQFTICSHTLIPGFYFTYPPSDIQKLIVVYTATLLTVSFFFVFFCLYSLYIVPTTACLVYLTYLRILLPRVQRQQLLYLLTPFKYIKKKKNLLQFKWNSSSLLI